MSASGAENTSALFQSPFASLNPVIATTDLSYVSNQAPSVVISVVIQHQESADETMKTAVMWHHLVHCTVDATLMQLGGCWKMWSGVPDVLLIAVSAAFGSKTNTNLHSAAQCAHHALTVVAQLQQSLGAVLQKTGVDVHAEFSLATGEVVAGIIGVRPPSFQVMGAVVDKARTLCEQRNKAPVKVTAKVAALLDLACSDLTCLGTIHFVDGDTNMYAVHDAIIHAHHQPNTKQLCDFQSFCEREMAQSFPTRSASMPAASTQRSDSIGQHDDLLSWLPKTRGGMPTTSAQGGDHPGDEHHHHHPHGTPKHTPSTQEGALIAMQTTLASNGVWGVCFHDVALEASFGYWINGMLCKVDLLGALLSLIILSVGGIMQHVPLESLALLLGTPAVVFLLALLCRSWYIKHRDVIIAVEQLAVLWPVLHVWHPALLATSQGLASGVRTLDTALALVRFTGVELMIKNSINHARFRYQVPLHLMSFAAIVKVCPPRLCVADGPVDMSPCWDMVVYGWQLSMGLCATLALLYAWESMMRLTFLCNHAVGVASGRRVVAEPTSQQGRA